jgi:hypothetical protein
MQPAASPKPNAEAATEDELMNEPQAVNPESAKVYTAKSPPQTETLQHPEPGNETHHLLEEIALRLKRKDREGLYREFSVFKLLAVMMQVIALLCLVFSIGFWLRSEDHHVQMQTMIGYSIALQLFVIALLMMHSRD